MGKLKQSIIDQDTDDDFPRGAGDPDAYGYPGEPEGDSDGPTTSGTQDKDAPF